MLYSTHGAETGMHCGLLNFYVPSGSCTTTFHGETEATVLAVQQLMIRGHLFEKKKSFYQILKVRFKLFSVSKLIAKEF